MSSWQALKKPSVLLLKIAVAIGLLAWLLKSSPQLSKGDILDWPAFCWKLAGQGARDMRGPARRIWELLPEESRAVATGIAQGRVLSDASRGEMVDALNRILLRRDLYREEDFAAADVSAAVRTALDGRRDRLSDQRVRQLNRLLLEASYPDEVAKSRKFDPRDLVTAIRDYPLWILTAFGVYNVCMVIAAFRWRILLVAQGMRPKFMDCIRMTYLGALFSCYLPGGTGGDLVKAYYVARDSDRKTEAATTVFLDRVLGLYCMLGVACVAVLPWGYSLWKQAGQVRSPGGIRPGLLVGTVLSLFFGATLALAVLLSRPCRRLNHFIFDRMPVIGGVLKRVYESVYRYRSQKVVLLKFAAVSIVSQLLGALCLFLVGFALNDPVARGGYQALNYLFLIPLASIMNCLPIAPAGLGVFEAASSWLFRSVGSLKGASIAALGHLIFILGNHIGLVFYLWGRRRVAEAKAEAATGPEMGGLVAISRPSL